MFICWKYKAAFLRQISWTFLKQHSTYIHFPKIPIWYYLATRLYGHFEVSEYEYLRTYFYDQISFCNKVTLLPLGAHFCRICSMHKPPSERMWKLPFLRNYSYGQKMWDNNSKLAILLLLLFYVFWAIVRNCTSSETRISHYWDIYFKIRVVTKIRWHNFFLKCSQGHVHFVGTAL